MYLYYFLGQGQSLLNQSCESSAVCLFQVTKERVKLLSHPLVTYLLRYKWRSFGRYVYYGRLILYGIFLFFLTGYAMHTTKSIPITECKDHKCTCNVTFGTGTTGSRVLWRKIGRPVILTTTSISIFLEVGILFYTTPAKRVLQAREDV